MSHTPNPVEQPANDPPSTFDDGDLYDLMDRGNDYGLDFYVDLATGAGGPVLEVACGTGRILLSCLQAGVDIEGLDLYDPMLDALRTKASALNLAPTLHRSDMSDFSLSRRYAVVLIPCNSFVHNLTQEAQIACLECCRTHLRPGGRLVLDTFFPSLEIIGLSQNTRVLEGEVTHPETGLPVRLYDTRTFDRVAQVHHSIVDIELLDADGNVQKTFRSEARGRYIYKHEMSLLLRLAGFARWDIHGDFSGRPLEREDDEMVVTAWVE